MGYQKKVRWTVKQEMFILNNYKSMKDYQMANILGRSLKSVRHKRQRLELEKMSYGRGKLMTPDQVKREHNDDNQETSANENINLS